MIDEAIVHVGMHKTGSSSIQETFSKIDSSELKYLNLGVSANQSGFFGTLLSENPENFHPNLMNGRSAAESQRRKRYFAEVFERELSQSSARRILISAELLSAPWVTVSMLETLRDTLKKYCRKIRVLGYVRPPVGYMQSALQQRLKEGNLSSFRPAALYPGYRKRFEKLDVVFGSESVFLIPFSPSALADGDVVTDFGARVGIEVKEDLVVRTNESLTLEASALLYVFRKYGVSKSYDGFTSDNNQLIQLFSKVGQNKLLLASKLVDPILEVNREDIRWMSERLATSLVDGPRASERAIECEDQIESVALDNLEVLFHLVQEFSLESRAKSGVVELIDRLRLLVSTGPLIYRGSNPLDAAPASDMFAAFRKAELAPADMLREAAAVFSHVEPKVADGLRVSAIRAERKMASDKQGVAKKVAKPQEDGR
jgi:hypothetical protein